MEKKDGLCEDWYIDGKLSTRANYKNGKREGLHEAWNQEGELWLRSNYKDGELDGLSTEFYDDAYVAVTYKDGKPVSVDQKGFDSVEIQGIHFE
jgi:antitoxin component YwqK of YwqJK toxin-antitoxin module